MNSSQEFNLGASTYHHQQDTETQNNNKNT